MTRGRWPARQRGPGFAAFPRHGVLRVSDLVGPEVGRAAVSAALAACGVPEGDRDEPASATVRAVVAPTAAGTVITLECRGDLRHPRVVVLRRLARVLDAVVDAVRDDARAPRNPGGNGTDRRDARS